MIRLELTVAELNLILNALGQRPYIEVMQLLPRLQYEAQVQLTPKAE